MQHIRLKFNLLQHMPGKKTQSFSVTCIIRLVELRVVHHFPVPSKKNKKKKNVRDDITSKEIHTHTLCAINIPWSNSKGGSWTTC